MGIQTLVNPVMKSCRKKHFFVDAICIADPAFDARSVSGVPRPANATAPAPVSAPAPAMPPANPPTGSVRIVEQPASKALRFRYECEGRSAGSIPGVNSTSERKTYPTIEINGCTGSAVIVVSCVTKDAPYKPHPHNLVGRERCDRGVCTVRAELGNGGGNGGGTLVAFSNLGIQCVKRKDIANALRMRQDLRVDPFKTGFTHASQPQSIDLNAVRLCFQVFVTGERGKVREALPPVVSDVIYDKKAMSDLHIARISHCSGPVRGRMTMILLCEKVSRDDTAVVFFEKENENVIWEAAATNVHVHKQAAIAFDTPPYRDQEVTSNVKVFLQLKRTTDNARSNALDFEYTVPPDIVKIKRKKAVSPFAQNSPFPVDIGGQIKLEPKDSPNYVRSPTQHVYPPYDHESMQRWTIDIPQSIAGPSQVQYASQGMSWMDQNYLQPNQHLQSNSPNMQPLSPHMSHMSPIGHAPLSPQQTHQAQMGMGHHSPVMGHVSPNMVQPSPNMGHHSPSMGHLSPNMGQPSPNMGHLSPGMVHPSTNMGHHSPGMGHPSPGYMSPGMGHPQTQYVQNLGQQNLIQDLDMTSNSTPSISKLLEIPGEGEEMRLSSDLSIPMCAELSDSLRGLSTKDLINNEWPPQGGG